MLPPPLVNWPHCFSLVFLRARELLLFEVSMVVGEKDFAPLRQIVKETVMLFLLFSSSFLLCIWLLSQPPGVSICDTKERREREKGAERTKNQIAEIIIFHWLSHEKE